MERKLKNIQYIVCLTGMTGLTVIPTQIPTCIFEVEPLSFLSDLSEGIVSTGNVGSRDCTKLHTHHSGKIARLGDFSRLTSSEIITTLFKPNRTSPGGCAIHRVSLGCGGNNLK